MFNVLIAGDGIAWESEQRLELPTERFLEHSGDESENISVEKPNSLKILERIQTLLLYEDGAGGNAADLIRLGQMRGIRIVGRKITFRFAETGRIESDKFKELRQRLQISDCEYSGEDDRSFRLNVTDYFG